MEAPVDHLSDLARQVLRLDAAGAYSKLVVRGGGNEQARQLLRGVRAHHLLEPAPLAANDAARGLLAGLWLWHDWLDESHRISQAIDTPTGSFWHAIMHRREGDFANSKYWYARCAGHPLLPTIAAHAGGILRDAPADNALLRMVVQPWNGADLVDLVEQVHERPSDPRHAVAVALQQLEWRLLFDHCTRDARAL